MMEMKLIDSASDGDAQSTFEHLMDTAPVMIRVSGPDKLCTWFNKPWLEFTGGTMAQQRGNGWAEGVHPDDRERCREIYATHFDRRLGFRMEYRLRRSDGEYRWLLDTGVPRFASGGAFLGYIDTCVDVNVIRKAAPAVNDTAATGNIAPDALHRMVGDIAHEFSNLVGAFLGDLWAIRKNAHDADAVRRRAEQAENALIQGQQIIDQLLAPMRDRSTTSHDAGSVKIGADKRV